MLHLLIFASGTNIADTARRSINTTQVTHHKPIASQSSTLGPPLTTLARHRGYYLTTAHLLPFALPPKSRWTMVELYRLMISLSMIKGLRRRSKSWYRFSNLNRYVSLLKNPDWRRCRLRFQRDHWTISRGRGPINLCDLDQEAWTQGGCENFWQSGHRCGHKCGDRPGASG
jgi:hypothetical protein